MGFSVGISGSLFWLCVCGPPTQHMGLLGWKPHFHGNLWASGSGLHTENHGNLLPGEGQKKLPGGLLISQRPPHALWPRRASDDGTWLLHTKEGASDHGRRDLGVPSTMWGRWPLYLSQNHRP